MYCLGMRQAHLSLLNQQMLIRGRNVHYATLDSFAILGLFYSNGSSAPEQLRQQALMMRIEMLHHQNATRKIARKWSKHFSQRMQSSRGSSDSNDLEATRRDIIPICREG